MSTNKSVARSASVIGLATLASRLLGFARDMVLARLFGIYMYAQAFVVAFKIPNLFRDLVGEGAANSAFVPVFSEYKVKRSEKEFWELANVMLNIMLVSLAVLTIIGMALAPLIVRLIAPGFVSEPQKLELTIRLARIIFPYIILVSLAAYAMSILNTLGHFSVPAFAPCLLNISIIIFAMLFGEDIRGLATGVLAGGFLQLAVQVPVLLRKGFRFHLFRRFRHPAAGAIGRLMAPRILSSSIYQLNNFVDSIFGSLGFIVGEGGVAVLYFSYRLIQFPLGIFSNALSQAILPALSRQALEGQGHAELKKTLSFGLRSTFFVMLPASAGFMALSYPIISSIFSGGRFDPYSVGLTSSALFYYSIGLFAYGATKILQSCFFALKDTVTPTKVAFLTLAMNIAFNAMLMFPMKLAGIALATSISGAITFFVLFSMLIKKLGAFDTREIFSSFLRIAAASVLMSLTLYAISARLAFCGNLIHRLLNLGMVISLGIVMYVFFCLAFKVKEIKELWQWLAFRRKL